MKKIFLIFATASFFAACNSDSKPDMETTKAVNTDSAQYQNTSTTDTAKTAETMPVAAPIPPKTETRKEVHKETKVHSTESDAKNEPATSTTSTTSSSTTSTPATTTTTTTTSAPPVTETPTVTPQKKGMSHSAKDAIIGGGAGAVGGAILSHKKGKGAIIGGVLGAGAGYIFGKNKDKKDTTR